MGYTTYTKLFESCVKPILCNCSSTWGYKRYPKLYQIQHRAMRVFLGLHRFNNSTYGFHQANQSCFDRTKNNLVISGQLILKLFGGHLILSLCIKIIVRVMKMSCWKKINLYQNKEWKDEVANKPKLRLYNSNMGVEEYIRLDA